MKKLYFFALAVILLSFASCNGGGDTSKVDLTGLEGTWDYDYNYTGQLTGPEEPWPVDEHETGYIIVTTNSVKDADGNSLGWSYDGVTLKLSDTETETESDADCGEITYHATIHWNVPIASGATTANISGSIAITANTEDCGVYSGTCPATGTVTKR